MKITYKFRLYPDAKQKERLSWTLDECRFVYNQMLEGLNKQDKPNKLELQNSIPELKREHPELKGVYSKVLQYEVYRLFSNLRSLAKTKKKGLKVGRLRFKGKGWFKTFTYNQSGFKIVKTNNRLDKLRLSKIGEIPIRIHREIEGEIKQITIKKTNTEEWFACIMVEDDKKEIKERPEIKNPIGIDVGIKNFLTDSKGNEVENPHILKKKLKKLKKEHRRLSRKRKNSRNKEKQRIKVAKAHEKVVQQRDDFLHKISTNYINNYDCIAVEDLNIKGMSRNHHLAQSILDCSWDKFIQNLSYKAERAGKIIIKVAPQNTTRICSRCGRKVEKSLAIRTHTCPYCGLSIDRDHNASINILKRGLEQIGRGLPEFTPVEIGVQLEAQPVVEAGSLFQNL